MADSKELQTQLGINQQINKVLADRAKQLDAMSKQISGQAQLAKELCAAMACKDLDGLEERINSINESLATAAEEAQKSGDALGGMGSQANAGIGSLGGSLGGILKKVTPLKGAAVGAGMGFMKGFKGVGGMLKMVAGGVAGIASGVAKVGMSIAMIPLKILGGFVDAAVSGSGAADALRQAMEKVRGEFGDLASGEGKALMDGFDTMRGSSSALAKSGMNLGQVFGYGRAGAAAMLEAVSGIAKAAGANFSMMGAQIAGAADKMVMMNKGLGMTNEALAEMARRAHNTGQDVGQNLVDMGSMAIQMGNKFGVSAKTIGKNMSALMEDVENFGGMSKKEFGATATYMAKLGLEAKDLQGVIGKFDDFESAAGSVSQLNQAFGIQLDTMEMMNAENPADRIDMMKNAFHEAGKSVEDMTRQEKKLMAEQMGLSVSAMENALATENMGTSYEDMEGAASEAEANKMSENEVMLELAKSVEKMVKSGQKVDGFFDSFRKGFARGFKQNKEYMESIQAIRESLRVVGKFGREVGKIFAEMMGTMGLFKSIKKIFDPAALGEMLTGDGGLLGMLKKFQKSTAEGGDYSLADMLKDMFARVKTYLTTGAVKEGGDGFAVWMEKMIRFMGDGLASALPFIVEKITETIQFIADLIRDPSRLSSIGSAGQTGIGGALADSFSKIAEALAPVLPLLWDAFKDLFSALYEKIEPFLMFGLKRIILFAVVKAVVSALANAAAGALVAGAAKLLAKGLGIQIGEGMDKETGDSMDEAGKGFFKGMKSMFDGINEIEIKDVIKAGARLVVLAFFAGVALVAFALGVRAAYEVLKPVPWEGIAKVFVVLAMSILMMIPFVMAALMMEPTTITTAGTMMLIGALFFAISVVAFAGAIRIAYEILKPVKWSDFASILGMVGIAILATIALAAVGLAFASVGPAIPAMIIGLVAAALLFTAGVVIYAKAIAIAYDILKSVPLAEFAEQIKAVGLALAATVAFGVIGATLAAFFPLVPMMVIGLVAAGTLFTAGVFIFGEAIMMSLPMFKKIAQNEQAVTAGMSALDTVVNALGKMGLLAAVFTAFGPFVGILKRGFAKAADFFTSSVKNIKDMIDAVLTIPMSNPDDVAKRIEVVALIAEAMQAIAGIGLEAAKMGMVSELMGGTDMPTMFKSMGDFLGKIAGIMTDMIKLIVKLASGLDEKQMKGVEVIASVLDAVAGLAQALFSPLEAVSKMSTSLFGPSVSEAMGAVTKGIKDMLCQIKDDLPDLIQSIIDIAKGITEDPATLGPKMDIITKAMSATGNFASAIGAVGALMPEDNSWFGKDMATRLSEMTQLITKVVESIASELPKLVNAVLGITIEGDLEAASAKIDVIAKAMGVVGTFAEVIGTMSSLNMTGEDMSNVVSQGVAGVTESIKSSAGNYDLTSMFTTLASFTPDETALVKLEAAGAAVAGLSSFMAAASGLTANATEGLPLGVAVCQMVEQAQSAITALNSIGDLDATVALDNFADAIGTGGGEFNITNEPVNITLNVKVTMNADALGKVLVDKSVMTTALTTAE